MSGAETRLGGHPVWPDPYVTGTIRDISGDWSITDAGAMALAGNITLTGGGDIVSTSNGNLRLIPNGSGHTIIGDAGSTSQTLNTNDDLFVSGRLEVDGTLYIEATSYVAAGAALQWNSGGRIIRSADDGWIFGVIGTDNQANHNIIITSYSNATKDHDHETPSTDPTLIVHSATDPDSVNTQWWSASHDQTHARFHTGIGAILVGSMSPGNLGTPVDGDFGVSGRLEVDGVAYFDSSITLASSLQLTGGGSITTTSGGSVTITPDGAGILTVNSGAGFTMTAAEKITIDAATTPQTNTSGAIDLNVEAGATGVVAFDTLLTSKSGGLGIGETIYAHNINLAGDASDNAQATLAGVHAGCDAVGSAARYAFWADGTNFTYGLYTDVPVFMNATNIATDTTTGMQIATGSTQKVGFYGTTPATQPAHVADPAACAAMTFSHAWDGSTYPLAAEGNALSTDLAALKSAIDANNSAIDSILAQLATLGLQAAS